MARSRNNTAQDAKLARVGRRSSPSVAALSLLLLCLACAARPVVGQSTSLCTNGGTCVASTFSSGVSGVSIRPSAFTGHAWSAATSTLYLTGSLSPNASFAGAGPIAANSASPDRVQFVIATGGLLGASPSPRWATQLPSSIVSPPGAAFVESANLATVAAQVGLSDGSVLGRSGALAVDGADNVYVVSTSGAGDAWPGIGAPPAGYVNKGLVLSSYDVGGNLRWARAFRTTDSSTDAVATGICLSPSGARVTLVGYTTGVFNATGGSTTGATANAGSGDFLVSTHATADGAPVWSWQNGGSGAESAIGCAYHGDGNVLYATGHSTSASLLGTTIAQTAAHKPMLLILMANGTQLYAQSFAGDQTVKVSPTPPAVDGTAVYIGLQINAGGALSGCSPACTAGGGMDIGLIKLTNTGSSVTTAWTAQYGSAGDDVLLGLTPLNPGMGAALAGTTTGSLPGFVNAGGYDAFLLRVAGGDGALVDAFQEGTSADQALTGMVPVGSSGTSFTFLTFGFSAGPIRPGGTSFGIVDLFMQRFSDSRTSALGALAQARMGTLASLSTYRKTARKTALGALSTAFALRRARVATLKNALKARLQGMPVMQAVAGGMGIGL